MTGYLLVLRCKFDDVVLGGYDTERQARAAAASLPDPADRSFVNESSARLNGPRPVSGLDYVPVHLLPIVDGVPGQYQEVRVLHVS